MPEHKKPRRDDTGGPRPIQMPGTRTVARCAQCGALVQSLTDQPVIEPAALCPQCKAALHSCRQCAYFDPDARYECRQPIPQRIAKKTDPNTCAYYAMRVIVEKETTSGPRAMDARQAFENLFKKK